MGVVVKVTGDFKETTNFLKKMTARDYLKKLNQLGARGVAALSAATPVDTGKTSQAWRYEIFEEAGHVRICWFNDILVEEGTPLVILLQYGHGTRNGGYVVGRDFINPTIRPIFDQIAEEAWLEVKNS